MNFNGLRLAGRTTVFLLSILLVGVPAAQGGQPTDAMRDFFGAVNLVLTDERTENEPYVRLRAIRRLVDDAFDVREAAMLALGREWAARTPVEQNEFVALFADLLERAFVWRMAGKASVGGGLRVQYLSETVTGDTALVDTAIAARDGNDLHVGYRLVRRGGRWVVRDVVMEGVSTMENYHAQFQRIVRSDGAWPELMAQLRAKVGTPPGAVQVAANAPVAAPSRPALVAPTAAPEAEPSPARDERRAIARDVAAVVTPGLAVRDPAPPPRPVAAPTVVPPPVATARPVVTPPPAGPSPPVAAPASVETARPAAAPPPIAVAPPVSLTPAPQVAAVTPAKPVDPPRPKAAAVAPPPVAPGVWVQVGAFRSPATAARVAAQVHGEILVTPPARGAELLLRVRVGPFANRAQAAARMRQLQSLGYQPFLALE